MTARTKADRVEVQRGTMGRESIVVDVCSEDTSTLFGPATVWWTELGGVPCCPDRSLELRHGDRVDAIGHARALVRIRKWTNP